MSLEYHTNRYDTILLLLNCLSYYNLIVKIGLLLIVHYIISNSVKNNDGINESIMLYVTTSKTRRWTRTY